VWNLTSVSGGSGDSSVLFFRAGFCGGKVVRFWGVGGVVVVVHCAGV